MGCYIGCLFSAQIQTHAEISLIQAAKPRPTADFQLTRAGWELNIRTTSRARKCGAWAKEPAGVPKSNLPLMTATLWSNFSFGDVHLNQSLSLRFTGTPVHFVGRPLSMANLKIMKM